MHLDAAAAHARRQAGPVNPVITRENGWLGDGRQPLTLWLSLQISADTCAEGLAYMRALTELASPCRDGN